MDYSCRQEKTLESSGQGVQRAGRRAQQNFGVSRDLHFYLPQALPLFLWISSQTDCSQKSCELGWGLLLIESGSLEQESVSIEDGRWRPS